MNKFTLLQPRREYEKFIKLFLRYALEKLGYLGVDDWLRWRELRNRLAHEYPDQPDLRFATLKTSIAAARDGRRVCGVEAAARREWHRQSSTDVSLRWRPERTLSPHVQPGQASLN